MADPLKTGAVGLVVLLAASAVAGFLNVQGPSTPDPSGPPGTSGAPTGLRTVTLACSPPPTPTADYRMMEGTFLKGCWGHVGLHQYYLGDGLLLHGGRARPDFPGILVTEADQSVPEDPLVQPLDAAQPGARVDLEVEIQTSTDGREWRAVEGVEYRSLQVGPAYGADTGGGRQNLTSFEFTLAEPVGFRFLRVVGPRSHMEGLAGYLDYTNLELTVSGAGSVVAAAVGATASTRTLSCERDILEDLFADHPCWYGGLNHWDAPSFFHTYYLGDARIDQVRAAVHLLPFRPQDSGQGVPGTIAGRVAAQVSLDGATWTNLTATSETPVQYGQDQTVGFSGDGTAPVRFLRLGPELHPRYDQVSECPACHRPEAYFRSSAVTIEGRFAEA